MQPLRSTESGRWAPRAEVPGSNPYVCPGPERGECPDAPRTLHLQPSNVTCGNQVSERERDLSEATQLCQPRVGCSGVTREPRHPLALPIRVSSRAQNGEPSGGQGGLSPCQVQACGAAVLRWHGLLPRPGRPVHGKSRPPRVGPHPQRERTQPVSRGCEVEPPPLRAGETEARRVSATPPNRQQTLRAPPG